MEDLLELVLTKIDIKSEATRDLRNQVLDSQGSQEKANFLKTAIERDKISSDCSKCDSRHFCSLFLACIYYELNDLENMETQIRNAIKDFYRVGSFWNELLARWINGALMLETGSFLPARRELERTMEMLEKMAKKFRKEDQYERRDECYGFVEQVKSLLS